MSAPAGQILVVPCCPLCGGADYAMHAAYAQFTWVRCTCGLIYKRSVAPQGEGADGAAAAMHAGETSHDAFDDTGYGAQRYAARWKRRVNKSRQQILDVLDFAPPGPLLDIGCSLGYTLRGARALGLAPSGADLSATAVAQCREQGFEAQVAPMEHLPWPDASFAIVTMKHVLEHTASPRVALREVRRLLRPGGGLFIAVPHADYRKAQRDPPRSNFFRPDRPGGIEHWVYYTPATLARLLVEEGYDVVSVHPRLLHRHAPATRRALDLLVWPLRRLGESLLTALRLRKEFWIVAVLRDSGSSAPNRLPASST